jgi:ligand-binding sensor protein
MELTDLQPIEKWRELVMEIERECALRASVYNTEGIRIADGLGVANRLCPEIKAHDKGQAFICAVAHMNMAAMAAHTRKPVVEECDAGLLKIVVPVFVKDEYLGAVGGCGLLAEEGEVDAFMISKTIDMAEEKIESLANGINTMSADQAEDLAAFIQAKIDKIVNGCR